MVTYKKATKFFKRGQSTWEKEKSSVRKFKHQVYRLYMANAVIEPKDNSKEFGQKPSKLKQIGSIHLRMDVFL
jgi:hypothetical protein